MLVFLEGDCGSIGVAWLHEQLPQWANETIGTGDASILSCPQKHNQIWVIDGIITAGS